MRWALALTVILFTGCTRDTPPSEMTDAALASELRRCRSLGLKAYESKGCRAAQAEQQARFLAPVGGADEHQRR